MKGNKPLAFYYNKYGGDTQAALEYTKDLILKYKKLKNKNFSDIIPAIELLKTIGANIVIYERMIKDDNKLGHFLKELSSNIAPLNKSKITALVNKYAKTKIQEADILDAVSDGFKFYLYDYSNHNILYTSICKCNII